MDPNLLQFEPMPPPAAIEASDPVPEQVAETTPNNKDEDRNGPGPLTIAEAKAGLALGLGVPETAIEITVRA